MKILSTPLSSLTVVSIIVITGYQEVSAQIGSIKSKQDEAAVLLRCYAEFTACPERKEYMIKMANYTECVGRQLNPANAGTNCDQFRPKTDNAPNCPKDAARPEEATAFINNCTKSKGYNIPYNAGPNSSNAGSTSYNAFSGSNDQYQAAGQVLANFFEAIREEKEAKRQLRESRRSGTQADKDALLREAAQMRDKARGKFLPFLLTVGGGLSIYGFASAIQKDSDAMDNVSTNVMGIAGWLAGLNCPPALISKISKGSQANKLERQANEMRVSFKPLIMNQQNGVVYSGVSLKLKF